MNILKSTMSRRKENIHPNITTSLPKRNQPRKLRNSHKAKTTNTPRPRWTDEEDKELVTLVSNYKNRNLEMNDEKWTLIGKELRMRSGRSCKIRYSEFCIWCSEVHFRYSYCMSYVVTQHIFPPTTEKVLQQFTSTSSPDPGKSDRGSPIRPQSNEIYDGALSTTTTRPRLQWSPFIFSDATDQSSSPLALNISPLKLEAGEDAKFSKSEVDALLHILTENSTMKEDTPAFNPICSPIGRMYIDDRYRYESGNSLSYSSTTDYNRCDGMMNKGVMKTPLCEEVAHNSKSNDEAKAPYRMCLSTPPVKVISDLEKYSAISSLTAPTTKSRKKARLSPTDEIATNTLNHTMPKLNEAKEIEIVWSHGEPLLCHRQHSPRLKFDMPDTVPGNHIYDSNLQALDKRASLLKIHDESNVKESKHVTVVPKPSVRYQQGNIQPSPEVNLQGSDMNRIIFGFESPSPTKSVSSVGCASPNVFDL